MGASVAPIFDGEVGDSGSVLGTNDGEKGMHGGSVFDGKGITGVEDRLGFGVDGLIDK